MPPREALVADLAHVATLVDGPPSANDYRERGTYSVTAIYSEFDSWTAAREAAGVDGEIEHPSKVARDKLLADIQRVADTVDGIPVKGDYKTHGEYSISTVYREFEGWPAARAAVGIEGTPDPQNKLSDDELITEFTQLKGELGHVPIRTEMDEHGWYTGNAYRRAFGTWNNAVRAAGFDPNKIHNKDRETYECD